MKYGIFFCLLGAACLVLAPRNTPLFWILLWTGISFCIAGAAYLGIGPLVFGKRPDGTMRRASVIVLLPFLLFLWTLSSAMRRFRRDRPYDLVAPGLYVGRRLVPPERPPDRVNLIVDLTCEFPEHPAIHEGRTYRAHPILDASVGDQNEFVSLVQSIVAWQGDVFVHCAEGRGRSGLVAAAVLLWRQAARTPEEAISLLQQNRPGIHLNRVQRQFLHRFSQGLAEAMEAT